MQDKKTKDTAKKTKKKLEAIYKKVDKKIIKYGELTNDEINEINHECRAKDRGQATAK